MERDKLPTSPLTMEIQTTLEATTHFPFTPLKLEVYCPVLMQLLIVLFCIPISTTITNIQF